MKETTELFRITKLYTGEDNKSYFKDVEVELSTLSPLGLYSSPQSVKDLQFRQSVPGTFDWHTAPQEQYIVYLTGDMQVEASGGETRIFKPGDILWAADLTGKGHKSTILIEGKALVIPLA